MDGEGIQSMCFILRNSHYLQFNFRKRDGVKKERTRGIYLRGYSENCLNCNLLKNIYSLYQETRKDYEILVWFVGILKRLYLCELYSFDLKDYCAFPYFLSIPKVFFKIFVKIHFFYY